MTQENLLRGVNNSIILHHSVHRHVSIKFHSMQILSRPCISDDVNVVQLNLTNNLGVAHFVYRENYSSLLYTMTNLCTENFSVYEINLFMIHPAHEYCKCNVATNICNKHLDCEFL